jgi:hypothetical protein
MYRVIQLRQALARRFADVEWPEIESEFWGGPESLLRYVAEGALDAVLDAVQVRGLANSGQLAPRLDDAIRKVGKAGPEKKRAEAKAESAGCIHCGGEGLASVRPRGDGPSYGAACVCAMGRWIKASNEAARAKGDADGSRRLLELADYPGQIRETQDAERESAEAEHHFGGLDLEHREDWLGWTAERLPRMARAARTRSAGRWAEKRFEIAAATACYRAERLDWPQPWEGLEDLAEPGVISRRVEQAPIRARRPYASHRYDPDTAC